MSEKRKISWSKVNYFLCFIRLIINLKLTLGTERCQSKNSSCANQRPHLWANGSFQNGGVSPQAFPPPLPPPIFFLRLPYSRTARKINSLLARWKCLLHRLAYWWGEGRDKIIVKELQLLNYSYSNSVTIIHYYKCKIKICVWCHIELLNNIVNIRIL